MNYVETVREFTLACNDEITDRPQRMSPERIAFIRKMVDDELDELEQADTITKQADALVDAIYYICDCAIKHGMNLDRLFEIVHTANMKKVVNGKVVKRDDGKIMKPDDWKDPQDDMEREIDRQLRDGAFT